MKRLLLITGLTLSSITAVWSQDTLRIMAYNVLNYGSGSPTVTRYNDLKTVIAHAKPDILLCSEIVDNSGAQLLLDNALNAAGVGSYSRVTFIDGPDTDNMLYYNNAKIHFKQQNQITTTLRNITRYRVYYLISSTDTAWMDLFSCHLKASTGFESERLAEVQNLCSFLGTINTNQNIIVGGDMNIYTSAEPAFQWMTSSDCDQQLYDPINRSGNWNNNSAFKDIHTQSTRTVAESDGGSTGGLDDRFDIFLTNNNVINGLKKVRYVPNTYLALGNDANHFNLAVTAAPTNTAVPASVATALYNMSDHLPIIMDIMIGNEVGTAEYMQEASGLNMIWLNTAATNGTLFDISSKTSMNTNVTVYDVSGKVHYRTALHLENGQNTLELPTNGWQAGAYIVQIESTTGFAACKFYIAR
jgi:endonuclease/exonuclease/phosphatase family metal-dependent hydrolase